MKQLHGPKSEIIAHSSFLLVLCPLEIPSNTSDTTPVHLDVKQGTCLFFASMHIILFLAFS